MGGSAKAVQKTDQSSTGTSTSSLPANQQPNVDLLMKGARDFYNTGGPQYYQGQTYAGPTVGETLGRQQMLDYAGGAGQNLINTAQSGDAFWMNPENIFNPGNIPGMNAAKAGIARDVTRNLTEGILPELRGGSIAQGALGGSRQEIGEGLAAARTSESIADAFAGMDMGAYSQGLNMYNAAANRAPTMFNLGLAPGQIQQEVGGLERADQQQAIDADVARFNFEELAPYFNLQMLQELTGKFGQYGGTINTAESGTSKTTKRTSAGGMQDAMQGLGAIATIAAMAMSHSSLKEEIYPAEYILPKLQNLRIFSWQYKGESTRHIGPMAEDFQRVFGVGDGVTLNAFDLLGVLLGAVRELSLNEKGA